MRFLRLLLPVLAACLGQAGHAASAERPPPGAGACSGCHTAERSEIPSLDGLSAAEIEAALAAYRSGTRAGTIMPRIAKGFSPKEAGAIAAFLGRDRRAAP